jgi:hypothetical protein
MVVRRQPLIQYGVRRGTKRSEGDSHGAGGGQTASDGARSLAPGLGPSHGTDKVRARECTVREAGGEKQREPGKSYSSAHEIDGLLRGGLAIPL